MSATTSSISASRPFQRGRNEAIAFEPALGRVALVAPRGLFRDSLAHVVARFIEDVRLECYEAVEDVVFGPARLGLISFDPLVCGREALRAQIGALSARCGGAAVGVVTPDERAPAATGLGALGVAGVVSLSAGMDVAVAAIHLMSVGGYCLPPEIPAPAKPTSAAGAYDEAGQLVYDPSATAARAPFRYGLTERECNLTAREYDVLRSLREGHQNKIIAHQLGISESTVKVHLRNIMKKLRASNRTQAALGLAPMM
jgi:DNA-binding NarL/FixJ family response regulator